MDRLRPVRVALISEHASPLALLGGADAGGQNVYVDEVSRGLSRLGLAVDVFTRRDDAGQPEIVESSPGVRVIHVPAGPPVILPKDDLWPLMPAFRDALLGFLARDGARYDVVHGNFWMSGWVAIELNRRLRIPAVELFHALGTTKRQHQGAADSSPPDRIGIERSIVRDANRIIAESPCEQHQLIDEYDAAADKVTVIPAGTDIERFRPVPRDVARRLIEPDLGIAPEDLVVVYVGRILPRKDVRNVVRAFARLSERWNRERPALKLLIVGGETDMPDPAATPELGELQRLAADLGVADRIRFTGMRQQEVLHHYYGAGDVAVTTPWYEPFGLTPLEAMACGRPVVGSAVGGITYTIEEGVTGHLVPPRDPETLAKSLEDLLADPTRRERMGRAARERVERLFTWPEVVSRTSALYDEVMSSACKDGVPRWPQADRDFPAR